MQKTTNLHIEGFRPLVSPRDLLAELPLSESASRTVVEGRDAVRRILLGEDRRVMVVVGPCSIHDPDSCLEYAQRLKQLSDQVRDRMLLIMRVYFEKPRTTIGWKGLINDPHMNDSFDVEAGLRLARRILLQLAELGLPAATEILEPITPQYIADLITLSSIGARTTESPTHRQMASGLSMPVGFKNGTDGGLQIAVDAMEAARHPHRFLGIDDEGKTCVVLTAGNPWGHLILRGGRTGPNFSADHLRGARELLTKSGLSVKFVVDCSHANSNKDHRQQHIAWNDVIAQRRAGNDDIIGLMLESNLAEGKQSLTGNPAELKRGVSITDACIDWDETERLIRTAHDELAGDAQSHVSQRAAGS